MAIERNTRSKIPEPMQPSDRQEMSTEHFWAEERKMFHPNGQSIQWP